MGVMELMYQLKHESFLDNREICQQVLASKWGLCTSTGIAHANAMERLKTIYKTTQKKGFISPDSAVIDIFGNSFYDNVKELQKFALQHDVTIAALCQITSSDPTKFQWHRINDSDYMLIFKREIVRQCLAY